MKNLIVSAIAFGGLFLASCSTPTTLVGMGAIYTDVNEGEMLTSNTLGNKVGTGSETGILGLVAIGDASIQTAAKEAGIKKISHVDVKKTSILGIYGTATVTVYGE